METSQTKNIHQQGIQEKSDLKQYTDINKVSDNMEVERGKSSLKQCSDPIWSTIDKFDTPIRDFFKHSIHLAEIFPLILALKFDLFEVLYKQGDFVRVKELSSQLKFTLSERKFIDWLDMLYIRGYLDREGVGEGAGYKTSEYTNKYLLKDVPETCYYMYHILLCKFENFTDLEKYMPYGKFRDSIKGMIKDENLLRAGNKLHETLHGCEIEELLKNVDLSKYKRIVDLCGKNGSVSWRIAEKYPNSTVVCMADKTFQKYQSEYMKIKGTNFPSNIKFEYSNPITDKICESDLIIVPHLHEYLSQDDMTKLDENIDRSLVKGGRIIILSNIINENRDSLNTGMLKSVGSLMNNFSGYVRTEKELNDCLSKRGYKNISFCKIFENNLYCVCAEK